MTHPRKDRVPTSMHSQPIPKAHQENGSSAGVWSFAL